MSEGPDLPPIPSIGEVLGRKENFVQKITTVIRCKQCEGKYTRIFQNGDYTFKKLDNENCPECKKKTSSIILEIYSEWINPKKEK